MQLNDNMSNVVVPGSVPVVPAGEKMLRDKPKKNTSMIVGMIILVLLAAGGIGFGVWAYLFRKSKRSRI